MIRTKIKDLKIKKETTNQAKVCGWVKSKRKSKNFAFLVINDGSSQNNLQIIVDANTSAFAQLDRINTGAGVIIFGELQESQGKGQDIELVAKDLEITGSAPADYPLQKKGHSLEFLREIAHLRPRTNTFGAVFRVRNILARETHNFFQAKGFNWVHTPIITTNDAEGAGELFQVTTLDLNNLPKTTENKVDYSKDFFKQKVSLTVTGQLQAEYLALSLGDVYTFGPTFRAENSNTARHLSEFWMVEPEMAFCDLKGNAQIAEEYLRHLFTSVLKYCPDEIEFFHKMYKSFSPIELEELASKSFAQITYTEAIKELQKTQKDWTYKPEWGKSLQTEHEIYISQEIFNSPVVVTNYPTTETSFYMRLNDDEKTVANMDILVPRVGEIVGGSQREDRIDVLETRMDQLNIGKADLQWYLDLRRFGSVPHAGFGLGFERIVMYLTGMANIRDVIPSPRAPHLVDF